MALSNIRSLSGGSAGLKEGSVSKAQFHAPFGLAHSVKDPNLLFVADDKNHRIRKIDLTKGMVSTVVGNVDEKKQQYGPPLPSSLNRPHGVFVDKRSGDLLIPDTDNHRLIRARVTPEGVYKAELLAGSEEGCKEGKDNEAQFRYPYCVISNSKGIIYAADTDNHRIVRISNNEVVTIAGSRKEYQGECGYKDGPGLSARFSRPSHLSLSPDEDSILVTDHGNQLIRRVNDIDREEKIWVETLAGTPHKAGFRDGDGKNCLFHNPYSTHFLSSEEVLVADLANHRLRLLHIKTRTVSTALRNVDTVSYAPPVFDKLLFLLSSHGFLPSFLLARTEIERQVRRGRGRANV